MPPPDSCIAAKGRASVIPSAPVNRSRKHVCGIDRENPPWHAGRRTNLQGWVGLSAPISISRAADTGRVALPAKPSNLWDGAPWARFVFCRSVVSCLRMIWGQRQTKPLAEGWPSTRVVSPPRRPDGVVKPDADVFNRFDDDNDSRCEHDLGRLS